MNTVDELKSILKRQGICIFAGPEFFCPRHSDDESLNPMVLITGDVEFSLSCSAGCTSTEVIDFLETLDNRDLRFADE
jgi:hypothetical protein